MIRWCQNSCLTYVFVLLIAVLPLEGLTAAEYFKARDIPQDKSQWAKWVTEKTELIISGRYEGRFSTRFRLARLDMTMAPRRATVELPDIEPGVRLSVYGHLTRAGARYTFEVSRIVKGQTDLSVLKKEAVILAEKSPEESYPVADRFQVVADFYDDKVLAEEILKVRLAAFARQRRDATDDPVGLRMLAKRGVQLKIPAAVLQSVAFESLYADSISDKPTVSKLSNAIRDQLEGWDSKKVPADELVAKFRTSPIKTYEGADENSRKQLHRLLYRKARLSEVLSGLHQDARNGAELSNLIEEELPEEREQIDSLREKYVDYRLARVPHLTRRQLTEMVELLKKYDRFDEFSAAVEVWLKAQNERLNNGTIDGFLETAEAYFYAFERWKTPVHQERGVELKMKAWELASKSAPELAVEIEKDLARLGWTRMHERWMTEDDVEALPEDDIELAIREGRVVRGMTPAQAMSVMSGKPERRIRVVSFRVVREIWVFGKAGSTGIVVHFQRKRESSPDTAVVTKVEKLSPRF